MNKKLNLDTDPATRVLVKHDILEIIKYLIQLINAKTDVDDIDHLSNRRVRTVGEQLANQFGYQFILWNECFITIYGPNKPSCRGYA